MSKKIKDNRFICLSAILRAKEAKMLSGAKLERMLAEPSFADACRIAQESGYEDMSGMDVAGINAALAAFRARELAEIAELAPDVSVLDLFRMRYGYHNAKVIVKSMGDAETDADLLSDAARFTPEQILEVYQSETGSGALPEAYAAAIREAKSALARTGNPQIADYILDKAFFAEQLREAKKSGKAYIVDYVRLQIDKANLRSALRTFGLERREELLQSALIEGGTVSLDDLRAALDSREDLARLYAPTVFGKAAAAAGMTEFEKEADNALRDYVLKSCFVPFGQEVIVEYLSALENEITSLRIILTGKRMGIPEAKLRERLRESYV
ncbi:MAG: hypothetical protein E7427_02500 [Ruminococcaceae bacterium]|nr:hypothetical protein [Oscillospiraceae bacterium]